MWLIYAVLRATLDPRPLAALLIARCAVPVRLLQRRAVPGARHARMDSTPQQLGRLHAFGVQQAALQTQGRIRLTSARASSTRALALGPVLQLAK
jgi:hypothetical protein